MKNAVSKIKILKYLEKFQAKCSIEMGSRNVNTVQEKKKKTHTQTMVV